MITLIAAIGINGELGKNNNLIWYLPGDLKFFKDITLNHKVIMGANTYLSIGKPLPKRQNIVLSYDKLEVNENEVTIYYNIDNMIKNEISNSEEVFIIGGASMYKYFYPLADRMYLTLIGAEDKDADTYFPQIEDNIWKKTVIKENEDNGIKYKHVLFERINK